MIIAFATHLTASSLLSDQFKERLSEAAELCEKLAELAEADAQKLREALSEVERRMALQAEYGRKAVDEEEETACAAAS